MGLASTGVQQPAGGRLDLTLLSPSAQNPPPAQETQRLLSEPGEGRGRLCPVEPSRTESWLQQEGSDALSSMALEPPLCSPPACAAVEGISAAPSEDNLRYFNVIILGPKSSPYQGGASCQLQAPYHPLVAAEMLTRACLAALCRRGL